MRMSTATRACFMARVVAVTEMPVTLAAKPETLNGFLCLCPQTAHGFGFTVIQLQAKHKKTCSYSV